MIKNLLILLLGIAVAVTSILLFRHTGNQNDSVGTAPSSKSLDLEPGVTRLPVVADVLNSNQPFQGPDLPKFNLPSSVSGVFDAARKGMKQVDDLGQRLAGLAWEEEKEIGDEIRKLVLKEHTVLEAPAWEERIRRLSKPMLVTSQ